MNRKIMMISEHASPLATLGGIDSGGQNVYVDQLSKHLSKRGYEVDIFTRKDNPEFPDIVVCPNGIRVIHITAGPIAFLEKEKMLPHMTSFTNEILRFIAREQLEYSLIHANFFMSGLVACELKKTLDIPFVITFHALGKIRKMFQKEQDKFPQERERVEERIVREADQIIAECPQDREDLIYYYNAHQDKITVIPCGFDEHELYPIDKMLARMTLSLCKEEKLILQLGRMVPRKGVDNAIEGLAEYTKRSEIPARLLIVGGASDDPDPKLTPEIDRLQKLAKQCGVHDQVTFVGRRNREQLKYYYSAADVFISTPWYEPFGITPLEAMACGTPVIGSNVGGIKFSVIHGKTGYLVEPNQPDQVGQRLKELFENEKRYQYMREQSVKRVNTFFTWATIANSVAALYEKILFAGNFQRNEYERMTEIIDKNFTSYAEAVKKSQEKLRVPIANAAKIMLRCISEGGKILVCGNGGSATDTQHLAVELVGHFMLDRRPALPAIALNTDTSILTALGNDFSFDEIFSRQVEALGSTGDVCIGISTSGNSNNVMKALDAARSKNMICIGLLGKDGGKMAELCDIPIIVPSESTQHIQEIHTHIIHTLCELLEKQLYAYGGENDKPMITHKQGQKRMKKLITNKQEGVKAHE